MLDLGRVDRATQCRCLLDGAGHPPPSSRITRQAATESINQSWLNQPPNPPNPYPQKRTGPRQVCFLLLLSFVLRTAWLAWYYFWDTDLDAGAKQRSPLQTLEVVSRLNLNLTFTAVSSLVTLWLRALSADPLQKARIKRWVARCSVCCVV